MSNQKVADAKLEGWDGPIFPRSLHEFHKIWTQIPPLTMTDVKDIARFILRRKKFDITMLPRTSDDYTWFCGLEIYKGDYKIMILFPWKQDENKKDSTTSDRHMAVYLQGEWELHQVSEILQPLIESMQNMALRAQAK